MSKFIDNILERIEKEIKLALKDINETKTKQLLFEITKAKKVFVTGQGRSGLISESFAMRLMQMGTKTYCIGDSTTPAISKDDLLIAISGSGKTEITNMIIREAKKAKARIILITSKKTIEEKAKLKNIDLFIEINAKSKKDLNKSSIEPLGTLFEQASLLYLDAVIVLLMETRNIKEKELGKRHANLE
jgi:6-phospho-3-hexuloisomerase